MNLSRSEVRSSSSFRVQFPEWANIVDVQVTSIGQPLFKINGGWEPIQITFIDIKSLSILKSLIEMVNNLDKIKGEKIEIEIINPDGSIIELFSINIKEISAVNLGLFDYSNSKIRLPFITIKPSSITYNEIKN